jgi:hypothetical protein
MLKFKNMFNLKNVQFGDCSNFKVVLSWKMFKFKIVQIGGKQKIEKKSKTNRNRENWKRNHWTEPKGSRIFLKPEKPRTLPMPVCLLGRPAYGPLRRVSDTNWYASSGNGCLKRQIGFTDRHRGARQKLKAMPGRLLNVEKIHMCKHFK